MSFDWKKHFPFKEIRKEQEQAIEFALNAWENKKKKFVILELPTGSGKSGIALTLARYYKEKNLGKDIRSTWITTPQKVLQEQYTKEFRDVSSIWSSSNYTCVNNPDITCDLGAIFRSFLPKQQQFAYKCDYFEAKKAFLKNDISLTNTSYFYNAVKYTTDILKRELLIVDECHNLDASITDFVSLSFDKRHIVQKLQLPWISSQSFDDVMIWIREVYRVNLKQRLELAQSEFEAARNEPDAKKLQVVKKIEYFDRTLCQVNRCIDRADPNDWVINFGQDNEKGEIVTISPIFSKLYTDELLFDLGKKILLMSGTILNKEMFCNNLGIKLNDVEFLSVGSPFPIENRKIYFPFVGSMSYKNIDATLPTMLKSINIIMDHYKDKKGVIHTNNYRIANYIKKNIKSKRLILHNSENRLEMLNLHIKSKEPTVLISPSFTEGIDLFGELSRFQILCKIPFPFLGDKYITEKKRRVYKWYEMETAKTIIQALGRSVRSTDDYADSYILDADFTFFYNNNKNIFPRWFTEAFVDF